MSNYWGYERSEEDNIINKIEYVKGLYDLQKMKVRNEEYIEELLLQDYVKTIKRNISKYEYVSFENAQKEIKETTKNKRTNIDLLKKLMLDDFLNNDKKFKITSIISRGYDNYGWTVEFNGYNKIFRIDIPIVKNLTTTNIGYANHGMFSLAIKNNTFWSVLKSSYKIKDIADYIMEYFQLEKSEDCK